MKSKQPRLSQTAVLSDPKGQPAPPPAQRRRLESIDAFRGFTILAMLFVIAVAGYRNLPLTFPQIGSAPISTFKHAGENKEDGAAAEWSFYESGRATPKNHAESDSAAKSDPPSMRWHPAKLVGIDEKPTGTRRYQIAVYDADGKTTVSMLSEPVATLRDAALPLTIGSEMSGLVADGLVVSLGQGTPMRVMTAGNGCTFCDLVAPFFVFIVGVCIPLSRKSRAEGWWRHAVLRTLLLIGAGVIYISLILSASYWWGILQAIGIAYLLGAVFVQMKPPVRLVAFALLAAFHQWATWHVPYWVDLGHGEHANFCLKIFQQYRFPSTGVARALNSDSVDFWGPLQVHCTPWASIGYGLCTILGTFIGEALLTASTRRIVRDCVLIGVVGVAIGLAMHFPLHMPINKDTVSVSYAIFTSGVGAMTFLAFWAIIDLAGYRAWAWPLSVFGANALLAYFLQPILRITQEKLGIQPFFGGCAGWAGVGMGLLWCAELWVLTLLCNRRGLYWKL